MLAVEFSQISTTLQKKFLKSYNVNFLLLIFNLKKFFWRFIEVKRTMPTYKGPLYMPMKI